MEIENPGYESFENLMKIVGLRSLSLAFILTSVTLFKLLMYFNLLLTFYEKYR